MSDISKDEAVEKIKMFLENKGFGLNDSFVVSMMLKSDFESDLLDEEDEVDDVSDSDFEDLADDTSDGSVDPSDDGAGAQIDEMQAGLSDDEEKPHTRKIIAKKPKISFKGKN